MQRNKAVGMSAGNSILNFWLDKSPKTASCLAAQGTFTLTRLLASSWATNTPLFNMNGCSVHLNCDTGTSSETSSSLLQLVVWDLPDRLSESDLAAVICPRLRVSSPVRSRHWVERLMGWSLHADSAARHRGRWGTPSLESRPRWKTARCPAQTAGFLVGRGRDARSGLCSHATVFMSIMRELSWILTAAAGYDHLNVHSCIFFNNLQWQIQTYWPRSLQTFLNWHCSSTGI